MSLSHYFFRGGKAVLPFILVIVPFGLMFGVIATEAGFTFVQTISMSMLVIAGASQLSAVALLAEQAPTILVIFISLMINLRMAMYSASLAVHIGHAPLWQRALAAYLMIDQVYAASILEYEQNHASRLSEKIAFYFGAGLTTIPFWLAGTVIGASLGGRMPAGLAFAVPITFVAMVAPMLKSLAHLSAMTTGIIGGLIFAGLPYNSGVLLAAIAGIIVGAQVEQWQSRRLPQYGSTPPKSSSDGGNDG